MKILVTGGAGIIGSSLVEKLSADKDVEKVMVYDNLSSGNTDFFFQTKLDKSKIKFVEGDILETRKIKKLVKEADVVVHLAALDLRTQDNASAHLMEQVNHWGTAELTYALENSSVKKLVYLSSTEVYGYGAEVKTEDSPIDPSSAFGISKWRGEANILNLNKKMDTVILRPGIVAGLGSVKKIKGVANRFFFDAVVKNKVSIHGNGKQIRPYVSHDYLIDALLKSVKEDVKGLFNVTQANVSVLDLLDEMKKLVPDVEFIFTNHHLDLPSLSVESKRTDIFSAKSLHFGHVYEDMLKVISI
jgi:UDP-glucose 4-epimerase